MAPTTNTTIHSVHISSVTINVSSPTETLPPTYPPSMFNGPTACDSESPTPTAPAVDRLADAVGIPRKTARKLVSKGVKKILKSAARSGSTSRSRKR